MFRAYLFIIFLLPLHLFSQSNWVTCNSSKMTFDKAHVESLNSLLEQSKTAPPKDLKNIEQEFFCLMPDSFVDMMKLLDLADQVRHEKAAATGKPPSPLYLAHPWVTFYSEIGSVNASQYYNKYIDMCIDGFFGADHLRNGFEIYKRLESHTKEFCDVLMTRTSEEVDSVFRFIFDCAHPENEFNKEIFDNTYPRLLDENPKLAKQFKASLEQLIKEKRH